MRKMRDFPSCFNESGIQIADSSSLSNPNNRSSATQNLVTAIYTSQLQNLSCFIAITWTKTLMGQGVTVGIQNSTGQNLCKFDVKPWLFSRRKGFKSLQISSSIIDLYWDFSSAKFGYGPEPLSGFYLVLMFNQELILLLGDLGREIHKKLNINPSPVPVSSRTAVFVAKREHIFGKKFYSAKAQFCDKGQIHDIQIECDTSAFHDPCLVIRIDNKAVMQVKRLKWKFRGNSTILVDGLPVEVYWDVHSWLFGNGNFTGNAVFLFQTTVSADKLLTGGSGGQSLLLPRFENSMSRGHGFSLILYAWKNE
ncbi:hypothetical protein M9H77_01487 [Catharanthus roseus]|uniref:Uncharacterized protein n=1 Tax=Catharanthus roseus TaxID=4058 RepID=A0ACC0C5W6_CATRO|nr:hypothetical protein M9H77_01487 [Catharanthus roseus]